MNARTFGRKGAGGAGTGPTVRHADPGAERRQAFVAAERARAKDMAPTSSMPPVSEDAIKAVLAVEAPRPPTDRSLKLSYALWFATGLFGGHRFYLRRPVTGGIQALIFASCVGAAFLQYYWAFAGLSASWLWMLADGIRLKHLHAWSGRE